MTTLAERILGRLRALGLTANDASLRAGLSRYAIKNILRGTSVNARSDTLVKLAEVLQCDVRWLSGVPGAPEPDDHAQRTSVNNNQRNQANMTAQTGPGGLPRSGSPAYLPVRFRVGGGLWVEMFDSQVVESYAPVAPSPAFAGHPQWMEEVVGDSVDLKFAPGVLVHVVDAASIGYAPTHGHWVILQRTRDGGHLVERSVKQVEITPEGEIQFWPRSHNVARWNRPITLAEPGDRTEEVAVVGLVLGSYDPLF